jgi:hypothetical protein
MAGPALQLFPPPPRAPRQTSPIRKPTLHIKTPMTQPTAGTMQNNSAPKPPTDFHELVIQVNSVPVSPSSTIAPLPAVAAPPRAHLANTHAARTPSQTPSPSQRQQEDYYRGCPSAIPNGRTTKQSTRTRCHTRAKSRSITGFLDLRNAR